MGMYTKVDAGGQPIGLPSSFPIGEDDEEWLPMRYPPARTSDTQTLVWAMYEGACVGTWVGSADPLDAPASIDTIKRAQEKFELSPIEVFGVTVDCDARSIQFIEGALGTWDQRALQPGVFDEVEGVRVVYWKASDNSIHPMTKDVLTALYGQLSLNVAERAQLLWAAAQVHKSTGCTLRALESLESFLAVLNVPE